jgi:hypothetical protein
MPIRPNSPIFGSMKVSIRVAGAQAGRSGEDDASWVGQFHGLKDASVEVHSGRQRLG